MEITSNSYLSHPKWVIATLEIGCYTLFDLPDTFIFKGTLANKQQMIANAVPLSLSTAIAKIIKEVFEFYDAQCIEKELLEI